MCKQYHPDTCAAELRPSAPARFKEIKGAYDAILKGSNVQAHMPAWKVTRQPHARTYTRMPMRTTFSCSVSSASKKPGYGVISERCSSAPVTDVHVWAYIGVHVRARNTLRISIHTPGSVCATLHTAYRIIPETLPQ